MITKSLFRILTIVTSKAGERGGGNTRGPECSKVPGNFGKMFVSFIIMIALCLS